MNGDGQTDEIIDQEPTERAVVAGTALALSQGLIDADAKQALAAVDRRIAFYTEVRNRSVKLTLPHDWRDFSGRPYLESTGAERLKPLWGIYVKNIRIEPTLDEVRRRLRTGEHVTVQIIGLVGSRVTKEESEFIGGRSSDDPFFAEREGGIEGVDPEDLVKAAYSNFEANAITRLLGLRGMEWGDLAPHGITREAAASGVRFRPGGQSAGGAKVEGLSKEIRTGLELVYGGQALDALKTLSAFKGSDEKVRSLDSWGALEKASEKWLGSLIPKVRAEVAAWEQRGKPAPKVPVAAQSEAPF